MMRTYKGKDGKCCRYCKHWQADTFVQETKEGITYVPARSGNCLKARAVRLPYDNHFCDFFAKIEK